MVSTGYFIICITGYKGLERNNIKKKKSIAVATEFHMDLDMMVFTSKLVDSNCTFVANRFVRKIKLNHECYRSIQKLEE